MDVRQEIKSICDLGEDELDNEQFEAAAKHFEDAVNKAEHAAALGPTHRETLLLRDRWVMGLHEAGDLKKAIALNQESLRRRLRSPAFGPTHEETLDNRRQLATSYSDLGNLEAAVNEYREVLQRVEETTSPMATICESANHLAVKLFEYARKAQNQTKLYEAFDISVRYLKKAEPALGEADPLILDFRFNIGYQLKKLGKYGDAKKYFHKNIVTLRSMPTNTASQKEVLKDCNEELFECNKALEAAKNKSKKHEPKTPPMPPARINIPPAGGDRGRTNANQDATPKLAIQKEGRRKNHRPPKVETTPPNELLSPSSDSLGRQRSASNPSLPKKLTPENQKSNHKANEATSSQPKRAKSVSPNTDNKRAGSDAHRANQRSPEPPSPRPAQPPSPSPSIAKSNSSTRKTSNDDIGKTPPRVEKTTATPIRGGVYANGGNPTDLWFNQLTSDVHRFFDKFHNDQTAKVKIALLDTGVCIRNTAQMGVSEDVKNVLAGSVVKGAKLRNGLAYNQDTDGHGTNCAYLLATICPYAEIYSYRVLEDHTKDLDPAIVAEALQDAIKRKVDIINMSIGWHRDLVKSEYDDLEKALQDAYRMKILLFAAVSNDGKWIKYPAKDRLVFAVDSSDVYGRGASPNPSADEQKAVRFTALGTDLRSVTGGFRSPPGRSISGSSFATPVAAATAALILEFAKQPPLCMDSTVLEALKTISGMEKMLLNGFTKKKDSVTDFNHIDINHFHYMRTDGGNWWDGKSLRCRGGKMIIEVLSNDFQPWVGWKVDDAIYEERKRRERRKER